jgi:hypothetical protein
MSEGFRRRPEGIEGMTAEGEMAKGRRGEKSFVWLILCSVLMLAGCNRKEFTNPNDPINKPPAPVLIYPVDDTLVYDNPPRFFDWFEAETALCPEGATYEFVCAEDADFANPLIKINCHCSDCHPSSPLLKEHSFWKVRAKAKESSENAWGEWSGTQSFRQRFPLIEGYEDIPGGNGIFTSDGYAYVTDYSNLHILDVKNPTRPEFLGSFRDSLVDYFGTVGKHGDYLYVACENYRSGYYQYWFRVYSVSDPSSPVFMGACSLNFDYSPSSIAISYPAVYIRQSDYLGTVNISDPENPLVVETLEEDASRGFVIKENYLILFGRSKTKVYDITDPFHPSMANSYSFRTDQFCVSGDTLLVTEAPYYGGDPWQITLFDVSTLPHIRELSSIEIHSSTYIHQVCLSDNCVAVYSGSNPPIQVFELHGETPPSSGELCAPYSAVVMSVNQGYLYLFSRWYDGMSVVRLHP